MYNTVHSLDNNINNDFYDSLGACTNAVTVSLDNNNDSIGACTNCIAVLIIS